MKVWENIYKASIRAALNSITLLFITTFSMTLKKTKRLVKMSLTQMKRVKMWMIMKVLFIKRFSDIRLKVKISQA